MERKLTWQYGTKAYLAMRNEALFGNTAQSLFSNME